MVCETGANGMSLTALLNSYYPAALGSRSFNRTIKPLTKYLHMTLQMIQSGMHKNEAGCTLFKADELRVAFRKGSCRAISSEKV